MEGGFSSKSAATGRNDLWLRIMDTGWWNMFLTCLFGFLSLRVSPRLVGGLSLSLRLSPRLVGGLCSVFISLLLFCLGCTKPCVVLCCGQGDDAGQQTTITQQPPHSDGTGHLPSANHLHGSFRPEKPASRTFSVSIATQNLLDLYSYPFFDSKTVDR